jgi:hypothetical protein
MELPDWSSEWCLHLQAISRLTFDQFFERFHFHLLLDQRPEIDAFGLRVLDGLIWIVEERHKHVIRDAPQSHLDTFYVLARAPIYGVDERYDLRVARPPTVVFALVAPDLAPPKSTAPTIAASTWRHL